MTESDDKKAEFLQLFLQYERNLRAFIRSLVPSIDDVDDVVQEASMVMWRKFDDLDDCDGFLPWAIVISRYTTMNYLRKKRRDRHVFGDDILDFLAQERAELDTGRSEAAMAALHVCLDKLGSAQRELVLAPYGEAGRVTRMAEAAGISVNSLYKRLGRLRGKLQTCVRQSMTDTNELPPGARA